MGTLLTMHLVIGSLLVVVTAVFRFFQPKEINSWYGYRTPRSMRSPEAWKAANDHSSKILFRIALCTIPLHVVSYFLIPRVFSLLVPMAFFLVGVVVSMIQTEKFLKKNYDL